MSSGRQKQYAYGSLAVLAAGFIAAIMASGSFLRGIKIDLTENNLYTLAPGTRDLLADLEEPINLYYFFSDDSTGDAQAQHSFGARPQLGETSSFVVTAHVVDVRGQKARHATASLCSTRTTLHGP